MKSKVALGLLAALVLVIFNLVFFSIWENMTASRWICWGVIHAAGILFAAAAHSTKMSDDGLVHAYPKMATAFGLFLTMTIVGILVTIWNPSSWKVPVVILSIFAFADLFIYTSLMAAEEKTIADDRRDARHKFFIQSCAERIAEARMSISDAALRRNVEKAYDAIRNAQVTSIPAVAEIEERIESLVAKLCGEAETGAATEVAATVSEIIAAVRKRDMEIRLSR